MSLPIDRLITRPRELVPTAGIGSVGATSADAALGSFSVSMACRPGVTGWTSVFMAAPIGMCGTHGARRDAQECGHHVTEALQFPAIMLRR